MTVCDQLLNDLRLPQHSFKLPENHARNLPQNLIFFDTETYQRPFEYELKSGLSLMTDEHLFRLAYAERWKFKNDHYEQPNYHKSSEYNLGPTLDIHELIDFLFTNQEKIERSLWIFCHNLKFDFTLIAPMIPKKYRQRIRSFNMERGKAFVAIKAKSNDTVDRNRNGCFYFVDTMNYFNASVENLGKLFGMEKIGKDIDFSNVSDKELGERCKRDVEIIRTALALSDLVDGDKSIAVVIQSEPRLVKSTKLPKGQAWFVDVEYDDMIYSMVIPNSLRFSLLRLRQKYKWTSFKGKTIKIISEVGKLKTASFEGQAKTYKAIVL